MDVLDHMYMMKNNYIHTQRINRLNHLNRKVERAQNIRQILLQRRQQQLQKQKEEELDSEESESEEEENEDPEEEEPENEEPENEEPEEEEQEEKYTMEELAAIEDDGYESSDSDNDIGEDVQSIIILPSFMNWYTYGYEHVIKSINGPLKVFDLTMVPIDIERILSNVKNIYFLRRVPDIVIQNQHLPCFQNINLILIPGTDGFAIYNLNITEIICVNPDIYHWANEVFEDGITITKKYSRNLKIPNPKRFTEHQVLFLHIMDSFISHTDTVLNAWLDKRISTLEPYPQLLILAEFSQFYQIFQIFRKNIEPVQGARTAYIEFKDMFKVKNRNIYISFHNYSYEELNLIAKSVCFMIQPGSSEVKKLARKWGCGLIAQNNDNGFQIQPKFIDHKLIFKRKRIELYVNEGDQEYPHKYTSYKRVLAKVKQATEYIKYTHLNQMISIE